jgi:ribose/xylose/arabinose/galactoside ABC-type transport system permease subunit
VSAIHQSRDKTERSAGVAHLLRANGIVLVFALFVLFAVTISNGRFLQPSNISIILFQSSIVGVLALGEMLVMLAGGIDLSIAALAILAAIIMGGAGSERQQAMSLSAALPYVGFLPAILIAGVSALLVGFVNGFIIMSFDNRTANGQAHTHPLRFSSIEGLKNALQFRSGQPRSRVSHGD